MPSSLDLIEAEQERARTLRAAGSIEWVASMPDCPNDLRLAALVEEVGEVARAFHDGDEDNLRCELIQVAAVAASWYEGIS